MRWMSLLFLWIKTAQPFHSFKIFPLRRSPIRTFSQLDSSAIMSREKRVVILSGPTAVGKSKVAAKLCQACKGLVVSADSVQAYRSVSIGANKPTKEEWMQTPHLLVDVIGEDVESTSEDYYNAAEWRRDALLCIQSMLDPSNSGDFSQDHDDDEPLTEEAKTKQAEILETLGKAKEIKNCPQDQPVMPVVVGGTMMYVQWLVQGRPDAIRPTEIALARAKHDLKDRSWQAAVAFVQALGPPYDAQAAKLCDNDFYRLRRIMEVAYTLEEQRDDTAGSKSTADIYTGERKGGLADLGYDVRCFFLCPDDRKTHCRIVDERCEQMVLKGLLTETAELAVSNKLPDMVTKAIGYRQTLDYLGRENPKDDDKAAFDEFMHDFQGSTRRYAKRQMQWFRKDKKFFFVPVALKDNDTEPVVDAAQKATDEIIRLLSLSREEFDKERLSDCETCNQRTRQANVDQAKKMKTFQSKPILLLPETESLAKAMREADECTRTFQEMSKEKDGAKRPRKEEDSGNAVSGGKIYHFSS